MPRKSDPPVPGHIWEAGGNADLRRSIVDLGEDGFGVPYIYYRRGQETEIRACTYPAWHRWRRTNDAVLSAQTCRPEEVLRPWHLRTIAEGGLAALEGLTEASYPAALTERRKELWLRGHRAETARNPGISLEVGNVEQADAPSP